MKKLLLILLCLPIIGFGQKTYVPDDNFEAILESNPWSFMGDGIANNDSVLTANINWITNLNVSNLNISDLTGIEDFIALTWLECDNNLLTTLDVSYNTLLSTLKCYNNPMTNININTNLNTLNAHNMQLTNIDLSVATALLSIGLESNQLTSLDVSQNTALTSLDCNYNQLTSLDLNQNTALTILTCNNNQLTSLDLSTNTSLANAFIGLRNNQLTSLDLRNGSNATMGPILTLNNPNLFCIDVDNTAWATANWTVTNGNIDPQHYFSTNCSTTDIEEHTTNKELLKVTDLLGRETKQTNQPLFYIYDDRTVEKRIVIE